MKQETMFRGEDGRLYRTETEAKKGDAIFAAVAAAKAVLCPKGTLEKAERYNFGNGGSFIQLTGGRVEAFLSAYREVVAKYHPDLLKHFDSSPSGFIGRYLGDGYSSVHELYSLASRIDSKNRLWGLAYFANNPQGSAKAISAPD